MYDNFSYFTTSQLLADKRQSLELDAEYSSLQKEAEEGRLNVGCRICNMLAALLVRMGKALERLVQNRRWNDAPSMKSEHYYQVLLH